MRILSRFHDYYDTALAYGSDPDALYQRETSVRTGVGVDGLHANQIPWNIKHPRHGTSIGVQKLVVFDEGLSNNDKPGWARESNEANLVLQEAFILIAGKAHPVWLRARCGMDAALGGPQNTGDWVGAASETDAIRHYLQISRNGVPKGEVKAERTQGGWRQDQKTVRAYDDARQRFMAMDFTELHLATQAPIILLANARSLGDIKQHDAFDQEIRAGRDCPPALVLNPQLGPLGMAKVLDPASLFQAIGQFISGVVPGQQMPMVKLRDIDLVRKKGFDEKYGFRTRPGS
jgi:hypothetical protein